MGTQRVFKRNHELKHSGCGSHFRLNQLFCITLVVSNMAFGSYGPDLPDFTRVRAQTRVHVRWGWRACTMRVLKQ